MSKVTYKRRIVQIAASRIDEGAVALYALADDGTLWRAYDHGGDNERQAPFFDEPWEQIEPLPDRSKP